jgi:hypothetical protein
LSRHSVDLDPAGCPLDLRLKILSPDVFRASLLNGADSKSNVMVNSLNVTDQLFWHTDITGASDAAVFAELAGNVADGIFAIGLG